AGWMPAEPESGYGSRSSWHLEFSHMRKHGLADPVRQSGLDRQYPDLGQAFEALELDRVLFRYQQGSRQVGQVPSPEDMVIRKGAAPEANAQRLEQGEEAGRVADGAHGIEHGRRR